MSALAELNRPPATATRKRLVLEPDQDFFPPDDDDLQHGDEQPPSDIDMDEYDAPTTTFDLERLADDDGMGSSPVASTSSRVAPAATASKRAFDAFDLAPTGTHANRDATKGKSRMTFEEEDEFGQENPFESTRTVTTTTTGTSAETLASETGTDSRTCSPVRKPLVGEEFDFTSKYGAVSALNLRDESVWIEQTSIEATRLDGTRVSFRRKKRLGELARVGHNPASGEDPKELAQLARAGLEQPFEHLVRSIKREQVLAEKQLKADQCVYSIRSRSKDAHRFNRTERALSRPERSLL